MAPVLLMHRSLSATRCRRCGILHSIRPWFSPVSRLTERSIRLAEPCSYEWMNGFVTFFSLPDHFGEHYTLHRPVEPFAIAQGSNSRIVGVHTGNGDFVWKRYQPVHSEASIRYEHRLLGWLAGQRLSFAVAAPVPDRSGDTLARSEDGLHALFPVIPGGPVDYRNLRQLESVGAALAELQVVLADYPAHPRPDMAGFYQLQETHPAIPAPYSLQPADLNLPDAEPFASRLAWWRDEMAALQAFLSGPFPSLPRQVIHGDYLPSNTLHVGNRLTGVVDFEFAGPDARAMDVASGLYFCLRVWEGDDPWLRGTAFCRGYSQAGRLADAEWAALPWLMRLRNAVSKIFWLGKSLAEGRAERQVLEMGDLEGFNRWLTENEARVLALFGEQQRR